jgi:aminopeptidase-like protein
MSSGAPSSTGLDADAAGREAFALMERLFPLCRSLTGAGVRMTFDALEEQIPLRRTEIPSGTKVFDWLVPNEWNIRSAYIVGPRGDRVVDLAESSLHVVSYSEPVHATMSLDALRPHLHTLPDRPDLVPYRTSYYDRTWGFCLTHQRLLELEPGDYEVVIDATLEPGHLMFAEAELPGTSEDEVLVSTYVCHPSLANDNLSGIAVAVLLAKALALRERRFTYRFLFAPGTIGPLAWLRANQDRLARIKHGLAIACLGDPGPLTYKCSRRGDAPIDNAAAIVLRDLEGDGRVVEFDPWGGDERQFCSPGFDLPLGTLTRTAHAAHPANHTSADDLREISTASLSGSVEACVRLMDVLETNCRYANLSPFGEPQLGRRGLYRSTGGAVSTQTDERALLWVLNQSDGTTSLVDIARRSGLPYPTIRHAAARLEQVGLLRLACSGQIHAMACRLQQSSCDALLSGRSPVRLDTAQAQR